MNLMYFVVVAQTTMSEAMCQVDLPAVGLQGLVDLVDQSANSLVNLPIVRLVV